MATRRPCRYSSGHDGGIDRLRIRCASSNSYTGETKCVASWLVSVRKRWDGLVYACMDVGGFCELDEIRKFQGSKVIMSHPTYLTW